MSKKAKPNVISSTSDSSGRKTSIWGKQTRNEPKQGGKKK